MPRFLLVLPGLLCCCLPVRAAAPARKVDFVKDVQPILVRSCVSCHGKEKQRGGLRLDDGTLALRGGNSGPVIRPAAAANSKPLRAVAGLDPDRKMPRGKKAGLSPAEIALLRTWIHQG